MNLTPEQLRQNAAAMNAHADGKAIEWRSLNNGAAYWHDTRKPEWDFRNFDYRPKPEPQLRPWSKPEDVPGPICWIRNAPNPSQNWLGKLLRGRA